MQSQSGGSVGASAGSRDDYGARQLAGGVHALTLQEAQASTSVVRGMIHLDNQSAHALFDTRATHSFILESFVKK